MQNPFLKKIPSLNNITVIQHLFAKFDEIYPFFQDDFETIEKLENWLKTWAERLFAENVTNEEIKNALIVCKETYPKPPSLDNFVKIVKKKEINSGQRPDNEKRHIDIDSSSSFLRTYSSNVNLSPWIKIYNKHMSGDKQPYVSLKMAKEILKKHGVIECDAP